VEDTTVFFDISPTVLPQGPKKIGEQWEVVASVPKDAPERVKLHPPTLKGKFVKRVRFDGREAVLVESHVTHYALEKKATASRLIEIAEDRVQYIDLTSGRTLWYQSESQYQPAANSETVKLTLRQEAVGT
jgi:hypothetical protein